MSEAGPPNIALLWMNGIASMLTDAFSDPLEADTDTPETITVKGLGALLERCPVALSGTVSTGGSIAVMLPESLAAHAASLAGAPGDEGDATIDDARLAALRGVADTALGRSTRDVGAELGQTVEMEDTSAALFSPSDANQLAKNFGPMDGAMFQWTFESGVSGQGMLVYSASIADVLTGAGSGEEPLVSDDEMKDILSGFGDETEDEAPAPRTAGNGGSENLDVILDIELVATARLGRVEMPIAEILSLGPGSIVEVGQFVDEPIELLVNNKLVARGDVVVVDEKFGLRITEIVSQKERIKSLR